MTSRKEKQPRTSAESLKPGDRAYDIRIRIVDAEVESNVPDEEQGYTETTFRNPVLRNVYSTTAGNGESPTEHINEVFFDSSDPSNPKLIVRFGLSQRLRRCGLSEANRNAAKTAPTDQITEVIKDRPKEDVIRIAKGLLADFSDEEKQLALKQLQSGRSTSPNSELEETRFDSDSCSKESTHPSLRNESEPS